MWEAEEPLAETVEFLEPAAVEVGWVALPEAAALPIGTLPDAAGAEAVAAALTIAIIAQ